VAVLDNEALKLNGEGVWVGERVELLLCVHVAVWEGAPVVVSDGLTLTLGDKVVKVNVLWETEHVWDPVAEVLPVAVDAVKVWHESVGAVRLAVRLGDKVKDTVHDNGVWVKEVVGDDAVRETVYDFVREPGVGVGVWVGADGLGADKV